MDFIKKNYEKILLGFVLLGLAVAVAYLPIKIANEKRELAEAREKRTPKPKPLDPVDMSRLNAAHKRLETPAGLKYSTEHNLLNPVQWQKGPLGLIKIQTGVSVGPGYTVRTFTPVPLTSSRSASENVALAALLAD